MLEKGGFPGFLTSAAGNGHGSSRGFGRICDRLICLTFSGSFCPGSDLSRKGKEEP
jgi:hypothetical protein